MKHELTALAATACKAHSVNYVVEAALEQRKQILTGDTLGTVSLYEVALKLLLPERRSIS